MLGKGGKGTVDSTILWILREATEKDFRAKLRKAGGGERGYLRKLDLSIE